MMEEPVSTPPGEVPPSSPPPTSPTTIVSGLTDNDRIMAALTYFIWFVGSIIVLLSSDLKNKPFLRYHAIQALGLSVVLTAYSVITIFMSIFVCCFWILVVLGPLVSLYYAIEAYQGKVFRIPVLTNLMAAEGWLPPRPS